MGEPSTIRLGLIFNVVGFGILSWASDWSSLIAGVVILAMGQGILTPTLASSVAGSVPGRAGAALGIQQSAGGLARVFGPLLGGALFAVATPLPYAVAAGLTLVALPLVPRLVSPVAHPAS
jgi:MFS transporter, DHA1 family, multidrug resistance protein